MSASLDKINKVEYNIVQWWARNPTTPSPLGLWKPRRFHEKRFRVPPTRGGQRPWGHSKLSLRVISASFMCKQKTKSFLKTSTS